MSSAGPQLACAPYEVVLEEVGSLSCSTTEPAIIVRAVPVDLLGRGGGAVPGMARIFVRLPCANLADTVIAQDDQRPFVGNSNKTVVNIRIASHT